MPAGNVGILARIAGVYDGFAYEKITVSTSALPLTAATYVSGDKRAQVAHITIESQPVNYTYDGTTPTATEGHNLIAGSTLVLTGYSNIVAFRIIRSGASDATIKVTYEA